MDNKSENIKANDFYSIQDSVAFNIPVCEDDDFYQDFTKYRQDFTYKKIFKHFNINPNTNQCNPLNSSKKIFLTGYRGTGKTSELLSIKSKINKTKCYFPIFVDIADEELDTSNIEIVDILILMLEKLASSLKKENIEIENDDIKHFYEWYKKKIVTESNKSLKGSAGIEIGFDTKGTILEEFLGIVINTKLKLEGSKESKEVIRREINNNFFMFGTKFNEFISSLKDGFNKQNTYKDILFIIDGFEKIGSLKDRKKILIDDSNRFHIINTNMIITLPIELFNEKSKLSHFANTENFPLIDLETDGAKKCFEEFILKRVDKSLFKDGAIDEIITYGAGHPRQTLQIINRAYVEATDEYIDMDSVNKALSVLGEELCNLSETEITILKNIKDGKTIASSDDYINLKAKNIILEYGEKEKINPIIYKYKKFQKYMK